MARGSLNREAGHLLRYGLVGASALTAHAMLASLLVSTGLPVFLSNLAGFGLGFVISAAGHTLWTFRIAERRAAAIRRFFLVTAGAFLFSNLALLASERLTGSDRLSLAAAVLVIPLASYLLARLWAFRGSASS